MKHFLHSNRRKYFANDFDFDPVFFMIQAHLWSCDSCIYSTVEEKAKVFAATWDSLPG